MKPSIQMSSNNTIDIWKRFQKKLVMSVVLTIMLFLAVEKPQAQSQDNNISENTFAQLASADDESDSNRMSIKFVNISIQEALEIVAEKAKVGFSYNPVAIPDKKITLEMNNVQAHEILYKILEGTNLEPVVPESKDVIVIREKENLNVDEILIQNISGTVTDAQTGEALPGVNVIAGEGAGDSPIGTTTGMNGEYEIEVPDEINTLIFSYVGYERLEVPIEGRTEINVEMGQDVQMLEDIVVVGYGTQRRQDLTGSVTSVTSDDFVQGINTSPGQLLQGKVSGAQVTQTTGEPGGGMSIRIRGASSINANNEPLYVIDGYPIDNSSTIGATGGPGIGNDPSPRDPLSTLNPNDIESIEILKDASATAIYGSRGANGVVLITTKKGERGSFQIDYSFNAGAQSVSDRIEVLSAQEYIEVINGISVEGGGEPVFSQDEINQIGEGTNWQDQIFRTAFTQNHNLSFSGGTENTTYRGSLNYFDQEGVVKRTGIDKYIGRLNVQRDFDDDKGNIGINLSASLVNNLNSTENLTINESSGPINAALLYDPTEPVYNEDGSFYRSPFLTIDNPMAKVQGVDTEGKDTRTFGNAFLQYNFTESLIGKLNFGFDLMNSKRDFFNSSATINGDGLNGVADISVLERNNFLAEYTMRYEKDFNQNHSLNLLGGFTYEEFNTELFSGNISNFVTEELGYNNLNLGDTGNDNLSSSKNENRLISYFGRANYQLMNKYLFTSTLRVDGSSRFGANNKFGLFPSVAFAWRLSEEEFVSDFFDDLKFRVSYGETGNEQIGNDVFLSTFVPSGNVAFGSTVNNTLAPSRIANPDLKWETTKQFDIGVDFGIWDSRVNGSIDWFLKNTEDLLLSRPLPNASGFGSRVENVGAIKNSGIEFQISTRNVQTSNLFWETSFNAAYIQSEVTDLGGIGPIITGSLQDVGNTTIFREGDPMSAYYGFETDGIFQTEQEAANSAQPEAIPGHLKFVDQNGDGVINADDRKIIGKPTPDWTFGITNNINYGNFNLNIFIQGQLGAELLNQNRLQSATPTNFRRNKIAEQALDRWTPQNTDAKWPSGVNSSANLGGREVNTLYLDDASYVRLKSVRVSYNIPTNLIRSASVYVTAENLITFTDYLGSNPEANALGSSNVTVDMSTFPISRTFMVGMNLGF